VLLGFRQGAVNIHPLRQQLGAKAEKALDALIPHVQEGGIAGGGNIALAFVNGTI